MENQTIPIDKLRVNIHHLWDKGWFLLTSGNFAHKKFNSMTVSWGSLGIMWGKPIVQVVVRPTRYTFKFMEESPDFTLCAFPETCRKALNLLGSRSGRDSDKIKESGLTSCKSSRVVSPSYVEANLVIECKKIYSDVFKPELFLDPSIESHYQLGDYHRFYIGEILNTRGDPNLFI